jgi:hypothetical protein
MYGCIRKTSLGPVSTFLDFSSCISEALRFRNRFQKKVFLQAIAEHFNFLAEVNPIEIATDFHF